MKPHPSTVTGPALLLTALPLLAGLSGCALTQGMLRVSTQAQSAASEIQALQRQFPAKEGAREARRRAQQVDRPWLAGRPQPLARDVVLPAALRAEVRTTLMFADGPLTLTEVAERLTLATGIPVRVQPEALLPASRFMPRLGGPASAPAALAEPDAQRIWLEGAPQPLPALLDRISARLGVSWEYAQDRLVFYRTRTQVFDVRALTLQASAEASIGLAAKGDSEGFVSTSGTRLSSGQHDTLAAVRSRIEPFLSQAGQMSLVPGAGATVVITDTPEVLQRVAAYLANENRALTRRVRLVFEELTLALNEDAAATVDWSLVFSSATAGVALASHGALPAEAAQLGATIGQGGFGGSELVVRLLGKLGKVVRRSSLPVLTLNRRPVTHAVRTTFSYIDQVQTTALSSGAGLALPSVSVSQREQTVGSLLTLVPDVQDDGQVLLSVAYDNTVAQPLRSVTFGDRANPLQLQQITIDGNGTVQQVALRPGQPLLIAGFERTQDESSSRRLNPGMPLLLGGSDQVARQRLQTVMVVTAEPEEGG